MMFIKDNFSNEEKYKLYRTMREIIHPSISKKVFLLPDSRMCPRQALSAIY